MHFLIFLTTPRENTLPDCSHMHQQIPIHTCYSLGVIDSLVLTLSENTIASLREKLGHMSMGDHQMGGPMSVKRTYG